MRDLILTSDFFCRPVLDVANDILGKTLVRRLEDRVIRLTVTEVEAYDGAFDLACHASKGRTQRTEVMFGSGGHFYVYLCYGISWMLNVVCDGPEYPSAILIRGVGHLNGPGKLTRDLHIDRALNGLMAGVDSGLWFENAGFIPEPGDIERAPRIGVNYAGPDWSHRPYRFLLRDNVRTVE